MGIGVSLWFDHSLEAQIRSLWREIADAGVDSPLFDGRYRPHITLGVWSVGSITELERALQAWVAGRRQFDVEFRSVGLFPGGNGVSFLQPVVTTTLLTLHREAHELINRLGTPSSPYFQPDGWVPHCTMAWEVTRERVLQATGLLLDGVLPLKGTVAAIGVIDTPAEVEIRRLDFHA